MKAHELDYALYILNNKPMILIFSADKSQRTDEITLLGSHVVWNGNDFTWKNFLDRVRTLSPKHVLESTLSVVHQAPIRKFANTSDEGLFDFFDIFNEKQIQYIKDFNIHDIGRYRINTVPTLERYGDLPEDSGICSQRVVRCYS